MRYIEYQSDIPVRCNFCGWEGTTKQAKFNPETQEEADLDCPKCGRTIAVVTVALYDYDFEEIRKLADKGVVWAKELLEEHKKKLEIKKSIEESLLKDPAKLPDLDEYQKLDFIWDFEWSKNREPTTIIRVNDKVIWKERAYFGGERRFKEVEELLKKKYGKRFSSLKVNFDNDDCGYYYYGD